MLSVTCSEAQGLGGFWKRVQAHGPQCSYPGSAHTHAGALPMLPDPIPPPERRQACGLGGSLLVPPQKDEPTEWCQVRPAEHKTEVDVTKPKFVCLLKPFISMWSSELPWLNTWAFTAMRGVLLACVC